MAPRLQRHPSIAPTHPGELLLQDVIPATGKSEAEIARLLGISRQRLGYPGFDILAQRQPVTPRIAVRLGKLFGNGAGLWVRMQAAHDLWRAEQDEDVSAIPTLRAA